MMCFRCRWAECGGIEECGCDCHKEDTDGTEEGHS